MTEHVEEVIKVTKVKTFKDTWFPKPWLAMSATATERCHQDQPSYQLQSGLGPSSSTPQKKLESLIQTSSKVIRRLTRMLDTPEGDTDDRTKRRMTARQEVVHTIVMQETAKDNLDKKISYQEKYVKLLEITVGKESGWKPLKRICSLYQRAVA